MPPAVASCMRDLASQALGESLGSRFSTWLLRPYLDLGPHQAGPTHAKSVDAGWQAYADPDSPSSFHSVHCRPAFARSSRSRLARLTQSAILVTSPRICGLIGGASFVRI